MKYYIGIDLGGTNVVSGLVSIDGDNYKIIEKISTPTRVSEGQDAIISDMIDITNKVLSKANISIEQIESIGVGSPGAVDSDAGIVRYVNNLNWNNVNLRDQIQSAFNKPTFIGNDANVAGYGEYIAGAGKGYSSLVAITLGTGVGGGVIIDDNILTGFNHAGAELGHICLVRNGRQCTCGRLGCFETYASATGLINSTKEAMEKDKSSKLWELCNNDINNVDGKTAFDGMRAGDVTSKAVVEEYIDYLSIGITDVINIFQPEVLCIGGGVCKEGDTLLNPVIEQVSKENFVKDKENQTKIVVAKLGNDAGVIGAALLGINKL